MHSGRSWRFLPGNLLEEWEGGSTFHTVFSPRIDTYFYSDTIPVARAVVSLTSTC